MKRIIIFSRIVFVVGFCLMLISLWTANAILLGVSELVMLPVAVILLRHEWISFFHK
jgi:uncharacterized membrane protein YiaA